MNKWVQYEYEKSKIIAKNLTSEQYEAAIKRLCDRLKI